MDTPTVTQKTMRLLQSRWGLWWVGGISFVESAFQLPIISDPFLIVYILANRAKWLRGVVVTAVTSALGGVVAYGIAYFFSEAVLGFLPPDILPQFMEIAERVKDETFALTILGAITPLPYTIVGLAAGFMQGNIGAFIVASLIGRMIRFLIVGYATYRYGETAVQYIKKHLLIVSCVTVVVAGVWMLVW